MSDHGRPEYATAAGNDYAEHDGTYNFFTKMTFVSTVALCAFMMAFAIGGVNGHWGLFTFGTLATLVCTAIAMASETGSKRGLMLGLLGLMVVLLILTS